MLSNRSMPNYASAYLTLMSEQINAVGMLFEEAQIYIAYDRFKSRDLKAESINAWCMMVMLQIWGSVATESIFTYSIGALDQSCCKYLGARGAFMDYVECFLYTIQLLPDIFQNGVFCTEFSR